MAKRKLKNRPRSSLENVPEDSRVLRQNRMIQPCENRAGLIPREEEISDSAFNAQRSLGSERKNISGQSLK